MANTYYPTATKTTDPATASALADRNSRRWTTAALLLVMVLASMEATVTATAMPTIIGDLHGLEHYSWVISIYLLTSTIAMPLYGRLCDVLGRKRVLLFAIALFCVASVLAAFSRTMGELILLRGIQGLGAAGIMPVVLTIIGDIFTLQERAKMQGAFSAVWGTASFLGPALGAFLVGTTRFASCFPEFVRPMLGWHVIFWVNLPAGFAGMLVLMLKYHDRQKPHSTDLDLPGVSLLAAGSTALLAGVSLLAGITVPHWFAAVLSILGLFLLKAFARWERVARNPIMPPGLMVQRAIGPSMLASALLGVAVYSIENYVPFFVQGGRGGSAASAAATVTPTMLAWASSGLLAAPLMVAWGFRRMATIGSVLVSLGLGGLLAAALLAGPLWCITSTLFITGCGFGCASMAMLLAAQDAVQWQQRGIVTSGITFCRNFGGALGVGLFGALFNMISASNLESISRGNFLTSDLLNPEKLASLQKSQPELLAQAQSVICHGIWWVFAAMAGVGVLQIVVSRRISTHKSAHNVTSAEMMEAIG
ncbi:MAG TPA: MFS transporter [Phycisphaerae bacterium]|nr:MFS transporter [Phycisphaerae bacterium]